MNAQPQTQFGIEHGRVVVARAQDVEPMLEHTKALHNGGFHETAGGHKYAGFLPYVLIEDYLKQKGITYAEFMQNKEHLRAMLNDPALTHFRVWKGAI